MLERPGTLMRIEEVRAGPAGGRPARPLFATPGIRAGPALGARGYIVVIPALGPPGPRMRPLHSCHGTGPRAQRDRGAAGGRRRAAGGRARPQGQGRRRRLQRCDLPLRARGLEAPSVVRLALLRPRAVPRPRAADASRRVRPRPRPLPVLRGSRREPGPRRSRARAAGLHVWENVVAACRRCNAKKMDRTPAEAGYHLRATPYAPSDGFRLTLGQLRARLGTLPLRLIAPLTPG